MAGRAEQETRDIDITTPNHARVYDYFLGGKDNFAADRLAADKIAQVAPDTPLLARANRGFLVRTVRLMAHSGIRQFIDLGTGIPTSPSVHEVARAIDPSARVVYVDNDPVVETHNAALLTSDDGVVSVMGDVRRPDDVLADQRLQTVIDFNEPVGLLCVAVLHLVTDEEDPTGILARFDDRLVSDSHVAVCQFAADSDPAGIKQFQEIYANSPIRVTFRPRDQIFHFFKGLEILSPGIVEVADWRPDMETVATRLKMVGGVGRKR
ncbi:MAG: SAM-dependent methyltransferase [Pseudonocardiaceae bacterium]